MVDAKCATNSDCETNTVNGRTNIRIERNGSLSAIIRGFTNVGASFVDFVIGTSTGHFRIRNSAETVSLMDCDDNTNDSCNFNDLREGTRKVSGTTIQDRACGS